MVSLPAALEDDVSLLGEETLQVILITSALPALGIGIVSPILKSLTGPFATSTSEIGLLVSAFSAPSFVIVPMAGILADRYGRKPLLVLGLFIFGLAGMMIAFTTNFRVAIGLRLIQGIGYAGITPIIITTIGDLYDGAQEETVQGFRIAGAGLSQAVSPLLGGLLIGFAWQYPFLLYALAIPTAALVYVSFEESADLNTSAPLGSNRERIERHGKRIYGLMAQRRVQAIVLARGLPAAAWVGFLTYNSILVVDVRNGTPTEAGVLASVGSLTSAVCATQTGRIISYFSGRYYPLLVANICIIVGFAIVVFALVPLVAIAGILIAGFGVGTGGAIYISLTTGLAPKSLRGSIVSLSMAITGLGLTLTPIFIGAVIETVDTVVGSQLAVQLAGLSVAVIAGGGGLLSLLIASHSSAVEPISDD